MSFIGQLSSNSECNFLQVFDGKARIRVIKTGRNDVGRRQKVSLI